MIVILLKDVKGTGKAGDVVKITVDTSRIHIFDKDTEQIIVH